MGNQVVGSLFDCDKSLTYRGLNSNPRHFGSFIFISVSFGESCLLISWCAGAARRATMMIVAGIVKGVEDLVQSTEDGHTCPVLDGRVIERSGVAVVDLRRARRD
jgi:hypothetical protein